ncbi:MAG: NAD(P)H-dependent oxidoreductase [Pseudoxanthomonas sp.]
MNLLHMDSSILGTQSASRELSAAIVARWQRDVPGLNVTHRDLAGLDALPHLDGGALAGSDAILAARSAKVMQEFLPADVIVIGVPMYNFGIPSQLKAWIDRVAVAGKTFRYSADGPEGLAGGKQVIVAAAYGGVHPADGASNFVEPYLRFVFGFLGITDIEFVHAQGLSISADHRAVALAQAHAQIERTLRLAA